MIRWPVLARAALGLLLALAWIDPPLAPARPVLDLLVLVDDSASVTGPARAAAWQRLVEWLDGLGPDSRVAVLRFAAEVRLSRPLQSLRARPLAPRLSAAPDGTDPRASRIADALDQALQLAVPDRPTALVLLSDGHPTGGDAASRLARADQAGIRLALLETASDGADAWIESLHYRGTATASRPGALDIRLDSNRALPVRVSVMSDGIPVAQPQPQLAGRQPLELVVPLRFDTPGLHRVRVRSDAPGDLLATNDEAQLVVALQGSAPLAYVGRDDGTSLFATQLASGSHAVHWLTPAQVPRDTGQSTPPALVILDDIAVPDLDEAQWRTLGEWVRLHGSGLLVLGGPHSFAAGGYRHSALEQWLPVTAEAPGQERPAALQFVLDVSGSMQEGDGRAPSALSMARQALLESVQQLADGDAAGLVYFNDTARTALPLARRSDPARAMREAWPVDTGGGTRLEPALDLAIEQLRASGLEQRLLVLITDGRLDADNLERLRSQITEGGVQPLVLAMSSDPGNLERLRELAAAGGGRVLPVGDTSRIPRLLASGLEAARHPVVTGDTQPRLATDLALLRRWPLPHWTAYALARPKAGAHTLLTAPNGDPLLVSGRHGAGRVAVFTAGFGPWAEPWRDWAGWISWPSDLVAWLARDAPSSGLDLHTESSALGLLMRVEAASDAGDWSAPPLHGMLFDLDVGFDLDPGPGAPGRPLLFEPTAPGQAELRLDGLAAGNYRLELDDATGGEDRVVSHWPPVEHLEAGPSPLMASAERAGFQPWERFVEVPPQPVRSSARAVLIGLVSVLYLLVLAAERWAGRTRPVLRSQQPAMRVPGQGSPG